MTKILDWITQQGRRDMLRFITCGSVDDGKSTLIGRLLWESHNVFDDQLTALRADSKRYGTQGQDIDFALLLDGLAAEREQGITIDVAYRYFSTSTRKFIVADTPGHEQYTRNMISGASTADAGVLLIDASKGISTQTKRHAFLLSLVGIRQVVLAVNKMDLIGYNQEVFDSVVFEFNNHAKQLNFDKVIAIPMSGLKGDNVTNSSVNMPWYRGQTLVSCLETLKIERPVQSKAVFPVQWVNRPSASFRGFSGTLASGRLKVGDNLRVVASGQTVRLSRIVTADGDIETAYAGDAVTLTVEQEVDISRGDIVSLINQPLEMTEQFQATLIWMHQEQGHLGRSYWLKLANQWVSANISSLNYRIDVNTLTCEPATQLKLNDIAVAKLALSKSLVAAPYEEDRTLGAFILVDKFSNSTVAAGMILHTLRRPEIIQRQILSIAREDRERLNGHRGKVIWLTGLSGSGKSTIANELEKELHAQGKHTFVLDGDNIRLGLNRDLGFNNEDRVENIRRVAEVAKLMMDAGLIVMTAFISPFRAEREMARDLIGKDNFIEVFIATPLEICEERDPKGLYKRARKGEIRNMTGIDSPYEHPLNPDIIINTKLSNKQASVNMITDYLSNTNEARI